MIELVTAVQAKNLDDFERVLKQHAAPIVGVRFSQAPHMSLSLLC